MSHVKCPNKDNLTFSHLACIKINNLVSDSDYDVVIILGVCLSNSGVSV